MDLDKDFTETLTDLSETSQYSEGFLTFVKDIIHELKYERSIDIPKEFIINMVKLVAIDPINKFLIKQQMVPAEVERLKRLVVERIIQMSEISRTMIRLQFHYREKLIPRETVVSQHHDVVDAKVIPLLAELKQNIPKHINHFELYYAKLIAATIHLAEMGPDTEQSVVDETRAIVEKIFHIDDINLLTSMTSRTRGIELTRIIKIAIGLRLLKKEELSGAYGKFIEELPKTLPRKIRCGIKQLNSMKSLSTERLIRYTTAIQKYFLKHYLIRAGRREVNINMIKTRQGLSMVHQVLVYIREVTKELGKEEKYVGQIIDDYKSLARELRKEKRKNSLANSPAYPKYIELCESWKELVDSNIYTNLLIKLSTDIVKFSEKELIAMDEFVDEFLTVQNLKIPSEQEFFKISTAAVELDNTANALVKRVEYKGDHDIQKMHFAGFCVNSLVRGVGMLMFGNPYMGVFTWKNMNFMFSTPEAVSEFSRNPGVVIRRAVAIARRWPELIILLNIEAEAYDPSGMSDVDGYRKFFSGVLVSKSSETQCDTHPIPSNIVESYTWNEWELRRRGIILSKIHKCRTHGTQTYWQSLRKSMPCQTFNRKSQEVQTNRDVYTQVPKTKYYFAGLRGYHCGMSPHIVELTTENLEDLHCLCKPAQKPDSTELLGKNKRKSAGVKEKENCK